MLFMPDSQFRRGETEMLRWQASCQAIRLSSSCLPKQHLMGELSTFSGRLLRDSNLVLAPKDIAFLACAWCCTREQALVAHLD